MRNMCIALIFSVFFIQCNSRHQGSVQTAKNDLLPENVTVLHEFNMEDSLQTGWLKGLKSDLLLSTILNNALKENANTYSSSEINLDNFEREHLVPIHLDPGSKNDINFNEILFLENWYFNLEKLCFYKWVTGLAPVKTTKDAESNSVVKKIQFWNVYDNNDKKFNTKGDILFAENITYEFRPDSQNSKYFDKTIFIVSLMKKILDKTIPVFDFYKGEQLSRSELVKRFGLEGEKVWYRDSVTGTAQYKFKEDWTNKEFLSLLNYNELNSFLFTEDWFISKDNSIIYKNVKSLCLIREYKIGDDLVKKILFKVNLKTML
jgi:hypothetical protein